MTVPYVGAYETFPTDGVTVIYPFDFKAFTAAEVQVYTVDEDGVQYEYPQSGFTVTFNPDNVGGYVTMVTAAPADKTLYVWQNPDFSQEVDFTSQTRFDGSRHEIAYDRAVMRDQWLRARTDINTTYISQLFGLLDAVPEGPPTEDEAEPLREVWLDEYYELVSSTDTDALKAFRDDFNAGTIGPCVLKIGPIGRGTSGRFFIDEEIRFGDGIGAPVRLEIEFCATTTRFTTATSKLRYSAPQVLGSSSAMPVPYFAVRGGLHQYTTGVDCLFWWDFTYIPSRAVSTGKAEYMRFYPQDINNAAHTVISPLRCSNTWYFDANRIEFFGRSTAGATARSFIEQRGLCVVTRIDGVDVLNADVVITPGVSPMVGVTGTFVTGTYGRGKGLKQGANVAYFGRNDGAYGYAYSLYGESGTLVAGAADLIDSVGAVVGSFTIATVARYTQCSEAFSVSQNSTFVNVNWFAKATAPTPLLSKFLNWNLANMHIFYMEGILDLVGCADVMAGIGLNAIAGAASKTCYKIDQGDMVQLNYGNYTTGGLAGKFHALTNIVGGGVRGNSILFFDTGSTSDNTVKDFDVSHNSGYLSAAFVNTGKRYNATNTRGIRFYGNGFMGLGVDMDDNRRRVWTPVVTPGAGAITSYTVANSYFSVVNGRLQYNCKITISNRGTASGVMNLSLPEIVAAIGNTAAPEHVAQVQVGNNSPAAAFWQAGTPPQLVVQGPASNTTNDAFKQVDIAGNYVYNISGSVSVEFD